MKTLFKLADTVFEIESRYNEISFFFDEYVTYNEKPDCIIRVCEEDIDYEWNHSQNTKSTNGSLNQKSMIPILERKAALRKITQRFVDYRILLMHGVVVSNGIDSIMFTAQSGEGKTTRAHLLIDSVPGTYILNGDKPLIKCGDNNIVLAHGSPWKGKENEGINGKAKLKGIFLLERSDRTEIEELTMAKSFSFLMNQTFMPSDSENIMKTMTLLHSLEGKVKLYRFKSTPTANSVQEAWKIALL